MAEEPGGDFGLILSQALFSSSPFVIPLPSPIFYLHLAGTQVYLSIFGVLTNMPVGFMMPQRFGKSNSMTPKYEIGQKVTITPVNKQHLSPRDSDIGKYAGQSGEIIDYYWVSPQNG